ncbi:TRAP transporter substrate-binding protein DctP [Roseibium sp.]|uniref:TRAP transporter substrate-binding protein n=1 Tax=Roseibium sp. TaxID=1936156 RepID=UPI003A96F92A
MKRIAIGLSAALAGLSAISATAQELRLGDFQSTSHIVSIEGTQKWMAKVEELTDGKVTFSHFPAQQAAKSAELLGAVKNGILDAALIGPIYNGEILPLNSVVGLPGFYTSATQGTAAIQQMMAEGPLRDELLDAGVVPIFGFVLPPYQVLSKKKRLGAPTDWKGLSIRTSGATQAMIARDLGAAGISIPGPEVYTAVERGRLDGVLFPLASVPGYNLQEVVKHISTNGTFGGYSFAIVVRRELFDSLGEDIRKAMISAGEEIAVNVAQAQDASVSALTQKWAEDGIEVYNFSDAEIAALNEAIKPVHQEWLERIGARSSKASEVVAQYRALTQK